MGYSPGFLLKNGRFSTLANSLQIDTKSRASSQKLFQEGLGGVSESLERFRRLAKIRPVQNHGLQPRLFAQKRPIFDPRQLTLDRHKRSRKKLEMILVGFRRRFRDFGAISTTCQNPPFSKPWAIAQAFCPKPPDFRPDRINPNSTQTAAEVVRNPFRRVQEAFQRVWSDFDDLPKSALFKTMGYSPGFLLKNGIFSTLANSLQIDTNGRASSQKYFRRVYQAFQRVWSDFDEMPKSALFKTMGYSPGFLLKNGRFSTLANSLQIDTNGRASSQKSFQEGLGGVSESLERFRRLAQIGLFQKHGLQPRLFVQKWPIFYQTEFTRNRHKQSPK